MAADETAANLWDDLERKTRMVKVEMDFYLGEVAARMRGIGTPNRERRAKETAVAAIKRLLEAIE